MATIEHDAKRWGWARAADAERSRLVRVGDLVDAFAKTETEQRAPADAAGIVLERLAGVALFELRKDGDARPVDEAWRQLQEWARPMGVRTLEADPGPADPRWCKGLAGAREFMRLAWCRTGRVDSGYGPAARFAVLEVAAVAAFPEVFDLAESRPAPLAVVPDRRAAQAAALAKAAPPADFVQGKPWTGPHKIAFVDSYDALIAAGMGKEAALAELAGKGWAPAGPTLQKRITEGNQARARAAGRGDKQRAA